MMNDSPSPAIHVSLGAYSLLRFGEAAEQWTQLADAVEAVFGGPSLRFMKAFCRGRSDIHARSLAARSTSAVSEAVRAEQIAQALLSNVPLSQVEKVPQFTSAVVGYARRVSYYLNMPDLQLPYELGTHRVLQSVWPGASHRAALRTLLELVQTDYACIYAGSDYERALSEHTFIVTRRWPFTEPTPAWIGEMSRIGSSRHEFGTRVRGAYWGNVFPAAIVAQIGGLDALRSTGAEIVEEWSNGRVYVQLTTTVGEAVTPAGEARLARLDHVLRPVAI